MRSRMRVAVAAGTIAALGLVGACTGSGDGEGGDQAGEAKGPARPAARAVEDEAALGAAGGSGEVLGAAALPAIGPSVIKTADLRLEISKNSLEESVEEATSVAGRLGGFVLSTSIDDEGTGRGSIVIRVPADSFETALADMSEIGDVQEETVAGKDVSEEFIDLEARLRNLRAQETVLLRLMDRARTIADTIRVQRELQQAQLDIERIRGRLRFLEDQTALSTISVSFVETGAPARIGTLAKAWERAADAFLAVVSGAIVATGFLVPVALLGAFVLGIAWLAVRKLGLFSTP